MSVVDTLKSAAARSWAFVRKLPRAYSIGGAVAIVAALLLGIHLLTRQAPAVSAPPQTPHVQVASVADLSSGAGPLVIVGKVTSLSQASILAQTSGELVSLNVAIGDSVAAGQTIGSFENASEKAAVQQAQGAYDAAVAAQSGNSGASTAATARNTYVSAYSTLDTAIQDIDSLFGAPTPVGPELLIHSATNDPTTLSRERRSVGTEIESWRAALPAATSTDPGILLGEAYATTQDASAFLTDLAQSATSYNSGATSAQLANLATARSAVAGLLSTLSSARDSYRSTSPGASASVEQALGALNGAKANLAKTVVRSPISGTIVSLPVNQGDFVSSFSPVATVSNPHALEIDAYVSADDAKTLAAGGSATIENAVAGTVVSVAPALDPATGKILVKIALTGDASALTDGDTVTVSLARATAPASASSETVTIPLTAAKITPQGPIVFTVSSSTLAAQAITIGTVLGDRVQVTGGLASSTEIVTDARGLADGETVIVDTP
jgi:RND family efflux transporter MFP subunit